MPVDPPVILRADLTEDQELSWGTNGLVRKRILRLDGLTNPTTTRKGDDDGGVPEVLDWLDKAIKDPNCPIRGEKLSLSFGDVYCHNVHLKHVHNQSSSVIVTAEYQEIGEPVTGDAIDADILWFVGAKVNGSTVNIQTSFNHDGSLIKCGYKTGVGPNPYDVSTATSAEIANGTVRIQYGKVPTLESLDVIEFTMREVCDVENEEPNLRSVVGKQFYYNNSINSVPYLGRPARTLRLRMMVGEFDAVRSLKIITAAGGDDGGSLKVVWDTKYVFDFRARGWDEINVLTYPFTGYPPPDMEDPGPVINSTDTVIAGRTNGNGWCKAKPYPEIDFSDLSLPNLLLPNPGGGF